MLVLPRRLLAVLTVSGIFAASGYGDPPKPSDADTAAARALLKDAWKWAEARPDERDSVHALEVRIAGVESDRHWMSFTTGKLRPEVNREGPHREHHRDRTLVGYGKSYFSDRMWQSPSSSEKNPFDPGATDRVGLAIDVESATLIMTLKSWGDGEVEIPLFATEGKLYGFSGSNMFVIDLKKTTVTR